MYIYALDKYIYKKKKKKKYTLIIYYKEIINMLIVMEIVLAYLIVGCALAGNINMIYKDFDTPLFIGIIWPLAIPLFIGAIITFAIRFLINGLIEIHNKRDK